MGIAYAEDADAGTVEITLTGRITRADYDGVTTRMKKFINRHGAVKLVEVVESFEGFEPSVIWPGIRFDIRDLGRVSHVAIVSDIGWISPISNAAGAFMSTKSRIFGRARLKEARAWIRAVQ